MKVFFDTIMMYRNTNILQYNQSVKKILEISSNQNNQYYYSKGLRELGFYHIIKAEYDSALLFLNQSQKIVEQLEDDSLMVELLNFKGLVYLETFDYFTAIQLYQNINSIAKKIEGSTDELSANQMIGDIYRRCKEYDKSLEYFKLSEPSTYKKDTVVERHGWWNLNIGQVYFKLGKYEEAVNHYNKSLEIWDKMDMTRGKGYTYNSIGDLYLEIKSKNCFENYYQAIGNNKLINNNTEFVRSYVGLGNSYKIVNGNLDSAAYYYQKAIDIGIDNNLEFMLIPALDFFIEKPEYGKVLNLTYKELLIVKNKATEESLKRSSNQDLKILASMEKIKVAEINYINSLDKTKMYQRIFLLLLLLAFSIIVFLITLFVKNKKLKESQSQIKNQFEVISVQAINLEKANKKLVENNLLLKEDLSINNLELLHSKGILKNIKKVSIEEKNIEINSIIQSKISRFDLDKEPGKSLEFYKEKDLVKKLADLNLKLNDNEIMICCMIKKGLATKEIANISHRSHDSLKVTRSRIRKKLKLDRAENLTIYLNKL